MKKLLFAPLACLLLFACKKEDDADDTNTCPATMATLAGTYKLQSIKYKFNSSVPETDVTDDYVDDCQRDDLYILNASGVATYDDAGVACDPNGDDTGTWTLAGTVVTIDVAGEAISGNVQSYDCTSLVLVAENVVIAGDKITFTIRKQ